MRFSPALFPLAFLFPMAWVPATLAITPNDPEYPQQWALTQMGLPDAWALTTGGPVGSPIIVAVLDSGVDYNHPDLLGNLYPGAAFSNGQLNTNPPMDDDSKETHGTHIAGIIGAVGNNGQGISGVNWSVRLMPVKVLNSRGEGNLADVAQGMHYAVDHGARIINLSLATSSDDDQTLQQALAYAESKGVLVVAAAGNDLKNNDVTPVFPGSLNAINLLTVAATTHSNPETLTKYSNWGPTTVHTAAPGGNDLGAADNILSLRGSAASAGQGYQTLAGTSMAAAHVSGLAALAWAYHPTENYRQIKARLINGVVALPDLEGRIVSGGRVDALQVLDVGNLPTLFRVTPSSPAPGDVLTLDGTNFDEAAQPQVTLAGTPLEVVSWSAQTIQVRLPESATSGALHVFGSNQSYPITLMTILASSTSSASLVGDGSGGGGGAWGMGELLILLLGWRRQLTQAALGHNK